jgi:hypothetical protein
MFVTGDDARANFVLLHFEDVVVWLAGVSDGVDGAGDLSEEVRVGEKGDV